MWYIFVLLGIVEYYIKTLRNKMLILKEKTAVSYNRSSFLSRNIRNYFKNIIKIVPDTLA